MTLQGHTLHIWKIDPDGLPTSQDENLQAGSLAGIAVLLNLPFRSLTRFLISSVLQRTIAEAGGQKATYQVRLLS